MFDHLYDYLLDVMQSLRAKVPKERLEAFKMKRNLEYLYHLMAVIHVLAYRIAGDVLSSIEVDGDTLKVDKKTFFLALARAQERAAADLASGRVAREALKYADKLLQIDLIK